MTRAEYYAALAARYKQVDWTNLESIREYNDYARELRAQFESEED